MFPDTVLALVSLIVQILLLGTMFIAAYLAKKKRQLIKHCMIMRIAVPVQILTMLALMLPSMLGQIPARPEGWLFNLELPIYIVLGLLVVILWIFVNLAFRGIVKVRRLVLPMRITFSAWLITQALGLHIYLTLLISRQ